MSIAVVAVGFNRPDSMERLLNSLCKANYDLDLVDLIISIDKGKRQDEVVNIAKNCIWSYGEKIIRIFPEKQGLRNHIIQCGDLTDKYDAVIILEDDLIVSKWFYKYVKQTIEFYKSDSRIAGISLYKHQIHPGVYRLFEPVHNGYDVFFMQFAMSWGQCWTKNMWSKFKEWYSVNEFTDLSNGNILPDYIVNWNSQSWLKYYMRYIVETNQFFIYPHVSLTTNASDVGEHNRIPNNDYQVAILQGEIFYRFPEFQEAVKYDVFFERIGLNLFPDLKGKIILDLYGNRTSYKDGKYCLSTKMLPYKIIKSIQLKYRPIEINCLIPTEGNGINLYDLSTPDKCISKAETVITRYDVRAIHWKKLLFLGFEGIKDAIIARLKKNEKNNSK